MNESIIEKVPQKTDLTSCWEPGTKTRMISILQNLSIIYRKQFMCAYCILDLSRYQQYFIRIAIFFCPLVYDGILLKQSRSRTFKWINIYYPNTFKPIKYQKNFKLQFYLQPHRQTTSNYHAHHGIGPNRQTAFRHFCNTRESCLSRKPYACSHLI